MQKRTELIYRKRLWQAVAVALLAADVAYADPADADGRTAQ
jgi:hypothetical protein